MVRESRLFVESSSPGDPMVIVPYHFLMLQCSVIAEHQNSPFQNGIDESEERTREVCSLPIYICVSPAGLLGMSLSLKVGPSGAGNRAESTSAILSFSST